MRSRLTHALLAAAAGFTCTLPAYADDTEIYANAASPTTAIRPNILLIVDTSLSMRTADARNERIPYDNGALYPPSENCTSGRIFYRTTGEGIPECSSTRFIEASANHCDKLAQALTGIAGRWTGKVAQWDPESGTWRALHSTTGEIECAADDGVHGSKADPTGATHAKNDPSEKWTSDSASTINWSQIPTYTFYSSNWLNWRRTTPATATLSRLDAAKNAVTTLAASIDAVNIGLMRFADPKSGFGDGAQSGALVTIPVEDINQNREQLIESVNSFVERGYTPLSESLHEAYLYLAGKPVMFGMDGAPGARRPDNPNQYRSPIEHQCQRSFVVLLTDGRPAADNENDDEIEALIGRSCDADNVGETVAGISDANDGQCLDDLAGYMNNPNTDMSPLPGRQNATTYTIAFGGDVAGASFLTDVATAGGGRRFDASNSEELVEAFAEITNDILNVSSTFATASIGASAFNRATSRDDIYFGLFAASDRTRWEGNLKKYRLMVEPGSNPPRLIIADKRNADAIDPRTGFFRSNAESFWSSPPPDGNQVTAGGAVSRLPNERKVYTYLGENPAGQAAALIPITHESVDDEVLGTGEAPTRDQVLDFARTVDVKRMGDPLHSTPAVVTYGGTEESPIDYIFLATNDGYLHAFDAETGEEKWAFVPEELLPRLKELYLNPAATSRSYGLDGEIRVLRLDRNNDGTIDPSEDRVWLYIGMRRGGNHYYGLDVTEPLNPKLLFNIGPAELPGVGETWSTPTVARVKVQNATQNTQHLVLIFGGGYDGAQENYVQVDDTVGNRIFMVDAKSGELLWFAGRRNGEAAPPQAEKWLEVAEMRNSIPSRVTVIDTDGDLYADRMYVGDMGGRVFRFDIFNGDPAKTLVSGGVFAALGQGGEKSPSITHTRRFYNAPDVALVQRRGEDPYYNIAIGSGYRGHPLHKETEDRFYSLRDKAPFTKFRDYSSFPVIRDGDLEDITGAGVDATVPPDEAGWKLRLVPPGGGSTRGEKVLAESTTVNGVILFTTYEPAESNADPCLPSSINRVYAVRVDNGRPALNLNALDQEITDADLFTEVAADGILGPVNVGLLRGDLAEQLGAAPGTARTVCLAGMHILGTCVQVSDTVRTFWRKDADGDDE